MTNKIGQQAISHTTTAIMITSTDYNKKSELMLMIRARAYSRSCLQVILVYLHPFHHNSLFCSQKSPKNH